MAEDNLADEQQSLSKSSTPGLSAGNADELRMTGLSVSMLSDYFPFSGSWAAGRAYLFMSSLQATLDLSFEQSRNMPVSFLWRL